MWRGVHSSTTSQQTSGAAEVDRWLHSLSSIVSTSSLQMVRACLNRSVRRAMARDLVHPNVVALCQVPRGRDGRTSKSLTPAQARGVLTLTAADPVHCYIVVSLLTGGRTEELRELRWEHVHLDADPPHLEVWRSVRTGGDTMTKKSRRTLALPKPEIQIPRTRRVAQLERGLQTGQDWHDAALAFPTAHGTAMDAANVRRDFRRALALVPGISPREWTPRERRHSFVSLLSDSGVTIEEISRLVGHSGTHVTELVYRKQLRPVIQTGATAMNGIFSDRSEQAWLFSGYSVARALHWWRVRLGRLRCSEPFLWWAILGSNQ